MKRFSDGPLDNSPSQDAVHPYDYDTSQNYTPDCPNCQRKLVLTTQPLTPFKAFTCPDCSFSIPYSQRGDTGTLVGETGTEHLQSFEGLVDKANKDQNAVHSPYKVTKRPKENPKADPMGHGVMMERTLTAFQADQPFPRMIHQEWETRNVLSNLIYGFSYYQLTVGQKDRVDKAMRIFWDSHGLFSAQQVVNYMRRTGFMDRVAAPPKKTKAPAKAEIPEEQLSAPEIVKKRVTNASKKVEDYLATLWMIKTQTEELEKKLAAKMDVPKLKEEYAKVLPYIQSVIKALPQHQATIGRVIYMLREASTRTGVTVGSVEKMNELIDKINQLVAPDKMSEWVAIRDTLIATTDVKESFTPPKYVEDPTKMRPKELEAPGFETIPPEELKTLLEPHSSMMSRRAKGVWESIKGWLNSFKSAVMQVASLLKTDQGEWEALEQELAAVVA